MSRSSLDNDTSMFFKLMIFVALALYLVKIYLWSELDGALIVMAVAPVVYAVIDDILKWSERNSK